jgi:taurine dioxygenase
MFQLKPAMVSILYGLQCPPHGGDTMFSNQYMAYETLSPGMKRMLNTLKSFSSSAHLKRDGESTMGETKPAFDSAGTGLKIHDPGNARMAGLHPLIRTHPETGRKALFLSGGHTRHFEDMTEEESKPLIDFLMKHSTTPEHTCRFRWTTGALAVWDNRCTQHLAVNDYPNETRVMHRITISGDEPFNS